MYKHIHETVNILSKKGQNTNSLKLLQSVFIFGIIYRTVYTYIIWIGSK